MVTAFIEDGRIALQSSYAEKDMVKSIPGSRWSKAGGRWSIPLSWGSCIALRGVFGERLTIADDLNAWAFRELEGRVVPALGLREVLTEDHPDYERYAPKYSHPNDHDDLLYPFQRVGRAFLATAGDALLCDVMGTGKTIKTMAALRIMDEPFPALIICPNSLKMHWAKHIEKWLPEATAYPLTGTITQRRKTLKIASEDPAAVVIVNIEAVRTLSRMSGYGSIALKRCIECDKTVGDPNLTAAKCEVHPKELNAIPFTTVIIDESHRIKAPKAQQTRAVWALCQGPSVRRRIALTGTPIANNPGDLWAIMHAISPTEYPTRSKFLDRYAQQEVNAFGYVEVSGLRADTKEELFRFFDPRMRRITKEQVLPNLPEKVRITRIVKMSPKQAKAYKEMAGSMMTELEDGTFMVAASNLAAQTRLLQLSSSYCLLDKGEDENGNPDPDPMKWKITPTDPSPKVDEMLEILDELGVRKWDGTGRSVVVAAEQRKLIELAAARLDKEGIPYVEVTGKVSDIARALNVEEFQDGKIPVLLMTYKAGGVGLTMTRADTMIRLQRSWSLIDNRQGEDRVHRIGSEIHDSVTIIDIITDNTIEVDQMRRLATKMQRMEELTRDRQRLVASGLSTHTIDQEERSLLASHLGEG